MIKRDVVKRKDGHWLRLQNSMTGPFKTKRAATAALRRCLRILRNIGVKVD